MKDGRTHMAHKAEHAVDLQTGAVRGCDDPGADTGDTTTMVETVIAAPEQVEAVLPTEEGVAPSHKFRSARRRRGLSSSSPVPVAELLPAHQDGSARLVPGPQPVRLATVRDPMPVLWTVSKNDETAPRCLCSPERHR